MITTFVSSPYSHPDPDVVARRVVEAEHFCQWLLQERKIAPFSPIVHWHMPAYVYDMPTNAMWWIDYNQSWLLKADTVHVLQLDGWRDSLGVAYEIQYARDAGKPIYMVTREGHEWRISVY